MKYPDVHDSFPKESSPGFVVIDVDKEGIQAPCKYFLGRLEAESELRFPTVLLPKPIDAVELEAFADANATTPPFFFAVNDYGMRAQELVVEDRSICLQMTTLDAYLVQKERKAFTPDPMTDMRKIPLVPG